jgi:hypothetical protein
LCNKINYAFESILLSGLLQYKENAFVGDRRRRWYSCAEQLAAADTVIASST